MPPPSRWIYWGCAAIETALAISDVIVGDYLLAVTFACVAVVFAIQPWSAANSYRHGWLQGRAALLRSQFEAQQRGLSYLEWVVAEAERDGIELVFEKGAINDQEREQ